MSQAGPIRSSTDYQLQLADSGVIMLTAGSTAKLPLGVSAPTSNEIWYVKNGSTGQILVATGTNGHIDPFPGGVDDNTDQPLDPGAAAVYAVYPDGLYVNFVKI